MKKSFVIHPILLAIYPVLFLFAHNIGELSFNVLILPVVIILCFSLLSWSILSFVLKDSQKSGFIVSLFLLLFFSYGHFGNFIQGTSIIWSVLFLAGIYFSLKTTRPFENYTAFLNGIAIVLVVISLAQIGVYQVKTRKTRQFTRSATIAGKKLESTKEGKELPNIFVIVLDGYARADVLEEIYGYENAEFLDFLTDKGFFVANQSRSNYAQTTLTFASWLNMQYLNDLVGIQLNINANDKQPLWEMIRQSKVTQFLKQRGYTIATFSAGIIDPKTKNSYLYLNPGWTLNNFQNALINTTPIPTLLKVLETSNLFDLHRKRIHFIFNRLVDLGRVKRPLFVFAHIEAPHPPFVFGPNGEKRNPEEIFNDHDGDWLIAKGRLTRNEYVQGYIDQLVYINKQLKVTLEGILSHSKNPPIIILSADHGPRSMLFWQDPDKTYMKEVMSILSAYHLPNEGQKYLYNEITPVNTFRVILNNYFGTDYKILKDESYFSTEKYCYKFYNVNERINNPHNEIIYNHLGKTLLDEGNIDKAIAHFSKALTINPKYADPHINLSQIYFNQRQYRKAIFHLKKAVQLEPENHLLHNDLGASYLKLGRFNEAAPHFGEAIKLKTDYVPAYINLGNVMVQQGRLDGAIDQYSTAIRLQPDYAEAHNNLGVVHASQGKLQEAIANFSEAARLDPSYVQAQNNLRIALGQARKAKEGSSTR
jgi:tetratricopeptide (TPR) repeat protein